MHYITGTSFSVKPDPRRGFRSRENEFKINVMYTLTRITKNDSTLAYTFTGVDRSQVTLDFESARDADAFISKLRNESIPSYESKESTDL